MPMVTVSATWSMKPVHSTVSDADTPLPFSYFTARLSSDSVNPGVTQSRRKTQLKKTQATRKQPAKIEKVQVGSLVNVTSLSVEKATGRNWDSWIALLDKVGARTWSHQEIVKLLIKKYNLGPWWQQWVAIGYEVHIGVRVPGQNAKGQYSLVVTKSVRIDSKKVWNFLTSPEGLSLWLRPLSEFEVKPGQSFEAEGGYFGEIRTVKKYSRVRLTFQDTEWSDSTTVQLTLVARLKNSTMVAIQHEKLKTARLKSEFRERWRKGIDEALQTLNFQK